MNHDDVQAWLDRYVEAWQSYDRGLIGELQLGMGAQQQVAVALFVKLSDNRRTSQAAMAGNINSCLFMHYYSWWSKVLWP